MKTKNFKLLKAAGLLLATAAISTTAQAGTITGSVHDTSSGLGSGAFNTTGQICVVCHTPHNAVSTAAPLWNHTTTAQVYLPYDSPTLEVAGAVPTGVSLMCLSCHDGQVGMDAFGGAAGTAPNTMLNLAPTASFSLDLTDDHPISMDYDVAQATDSSLWVSTSAANIGEGAQTKTGNIGVTLLNGGTTVECSSCHDVHNTYTTTTNAVADYKLLKITMDGSGLCTTCHNK